MCRYDDLVDSFRYKLKALYDKCVHNLKAKQFFSKCLRLKQSFMKQREKWKNYK
jgi:hypothetical protein